MNYGVQVSRDSTFGIIDLEVAGFPETQFTPTTNLADSSSYTWRVRTTTVYGIDRWSENRLPFTVDATPPAVQVLEPNGVESSWPCVMKYFRPGATRSASRTR